MLKNPIIETMMNRKSIRKYSDKLPSNEELTTIVQAGQQAPFAYQLCSVLLSRKKNKNPFGSPWLFTICLDANRLEKIMAQRNWKVASNDIAFLIFGIQDASLMAENMVIAAESLGLGSCFIGSTPYIAKSIIKKYKLPKRVFPIVQLTMGYPAEDPTTRPRYPLEFTLFEDKYPEFDENIINKAMTEMDEGYLDQEYYRCANFMIPLEGDRKETFDFTNYSWTEHISRKAGQWDPFPDDLVEQLAACGFHIPVKQNKYNEN
ncbi:MAG: nitroreductase family protein [Candidatus Cloacimonetes bacterium]|nr:nitroreductase family protein [Candidatus Cloacimonadota bacterium]